MSSPTQQEWKRITLVSSFLVTATTLAAILTGFWVLAAIPIGFLFGFFLQKGDLCGASAFSEVIAMRDRSKIHGMWVAIVVAMVGFAILDMLGLVRLNPKPFLWQNYLVGGTIFGIGTVLAGGCVSGCLFKAATGNLNSMAALVGIPIGIALVEFGPLRDLHAGMKNHVIQTSGGEVLSLPAITGLPFWLLAGILGGLTVFIVVIARRRRALHHPPSHSVRTDTRIAGQQDPGSGLARLLTRPWRPWVAGIAIGLLAVPAYLSSAGSGRNYPLGVTHGVLQIQLLVTDHNFKQVWRAQPAPTQSPSHQADVSSSSADQPPPPPTNPAPVPKKIVWWLVALVLGILPGSWVAARLSGQARLLPKPPPETVIAFFGGILVGCGAALATGCVVGNILSGWALLSLGNVLFAVVVILANWATTYFYLMGESPRTVFESLSHRSTKR